MKGAARDGTKLGPWARLSAGLGFPPRDEGVKDETCLLGSVCAFLETEKKTVLSPLLCPVAFRQSLHPPLSSSGKWVWKGLLPHLHLLPEGMSVGVNQGIGILAQPPF